MKSTDLKPGYERVYTVLDYCDGPRQGIADFQGKAHLYETNVSLMNPKTITLSRFF
jgi:hypothetical protein